MFKIISVMCFLCHISNGFLMSKTDAQLVIKIPIGMERVMLRNVTSDSCVHCRAENKDVNNEVKWGGKLTYNILNPKLQLHYKILYNH